jgi:hypothetical protein
MHPIHRLPVELLTDIFVQIHKSTIDSAIGLRLCRPKPGCLMLPLSTIVVLGGVSGYWRTVAHSIPFFLCSVTLTRKRLPLWWKESLRSALIGRRGLELFICNCNINTRLSRAIDDVRVTWVRSLTIKGYNCTEWTRFLESGPLSRLEELNFAQWSTNTGFDVPQKLSRTLRTLITYECIPAFHCVFPKLRKLSVIFSEDNPPRRVYWPQGQGTLSTVAPNLDELCTLHGSSLPVTNDLNTMAEDIELDWSTIQTLASLSPGKMKIPAKRMRVRMPDNVPSSGTIHATWGNHQSGESSSMERTWNSFFITIGLGGIVQKLVLCGYLRCGTWGDNPLQPFTSLKALELEGPMGRLLLNSLSIKDSGKCVESDATNEGQNKEMQEVAVACPNLEQLVIRDSDLDGEALTRVISERNNSVRLLKGKACLLKHVEIWNCPGVSAEVGRGLRILRDQDV